MDESQLPYEQQSLTYRLRKRAEIRRQIQTRKSVQNGEPDRLADLLEEAASAIDDLNKQLYNCVEFIDNAFEAHPNLDVDIEHVINNTDKHSR